MERAMMRRMLGIVVLALGLASVLAPPVASADPGTNNPQVKYRSFSCDNGKTYNAGFVGPSGSFFLADSTSVFAIKIFTEVLPSGETKVFNYGLPGFNSNSLVTCSYTDPQGVFNIFSGFFTPRS
jgi:hypothetical protein